MKREALVAGLEEYKYLGDQIQILQYGEQAEKLEAVRVEFIEALNELPYVQRDILWRHYIRGEYWVQICRVHHYSERQIYRLAEKGLDRLGQVIERYPAAAEFCCRSGGADTLI